SAIASRTRSSSTWPTGSSPRPITTQSGRGDSSPSRDRPDAPGALNATRQRLVARRGSLLQAAPQKHEAARRAMASPLSSANSGSAGVGLEPALGVVGDGAGLAALGHHGIQRLEDTGIVFALDVHAGQLGLHRDGIQRVVQLVQRILEITPFGFGQRHVGYTVFSSSYSQRRL